MISTRAPATAILGLGRWWGCAHRGAAEAHSCWTCLVLPFCTPPAPMRALHPLRALPPPGRLKWRRPAPPRSARRRQAMPSLHCPRPPCLTGRHGCQAATSRIAARECRPREHDPRERVLEAAALAPDSPGPRLPARLRALLLELLPSAVCAATPALYGRLWLRPQRLPRLTGTYCAPLHRHRCVCG